MPTIIDRAKAAWTGDDAERLAKRREHKAELARRLALKSRATAIGTQLRGLQTREDKAVQKHKAECDPIQAELAELEVKATDAILAGEEISDRVTRRRGELVGKVAEANNRLETEIDAIKKLRKHLAAELQKHRQEINGIPAIRGKLAAVGVANPDLLRQRHSNVRARYWATQRFGEAERELQLAKNALHYAEQRRDNSWQINSRGERVGPEPTPLPGELEARRDVDWWTWEVGQAYEALQDLQAEKQRLAEAIVAE